MNRLITVRADGLRYLGGRRFGAWLSKVSSCCPTCLVYGSRFAELTVRGRSLGVCW
jgi:hypothetical protein